MALIWAAFSLLFGLCLAIDNSVPRRDINGQLMDVHDGNVILIGGLYHWYGMGYTDCELETGLIPPQNCPGIYSEFGRCGFRTDHAVNLYTSPDLENWTFVANIFPQEARPDGIYFRPKVIFNALTHKYVLWINHLPPAVSPLVAYPDARLMVATADAPNGPFDIVTIKADIEESGGGDFTLMIDPNNVVANNTAFLAYDAWGNNHALVIEQLNPQFTNALGASASSGRISPISNEAPLLFERKGYYYLMYGHTCCFCHQGSGAEVWTARHPLGPWTNMNLDINPSHLFTGREIKAQCNFVLKIDRGEGNEADYIYTGDLWSSAPDGLKSHDIQYWSPPLQFDDSVTPPTIQPMTFVRNFTLDLN